MRLEAMIFRILSTKYYEHRLKLLYIIEEATLLLFIIIYYAKSYSKYNTHTNTHKTSS